MIALLIALNCLTPKMTNLSDEPWERFDLHAAQRSAVVCRETYDACLVEFTKVRYHTYRATCGNSTKGEVL